VLSVSVSSTHATPPTAPSRNGSRIPRRRASRLLVLLSSYRCCRPRGAILQRLGALAVRADGPPASEAGSTRAEARTRRATPVLVLVTRLRHDERVSCILAGLSRRCWCAGLAPLLRVSRGRPCP